MNKSGKSTKMVASDTKPSEVQKDLSALKRERDLLLEKLFNRNEQLSQLKKTRIETEESCVLHWELLQDMEVALEEERRLRKTREKELQRCKQLVKAKAKKVKQDLEEQVNLNHHLNLKLRLKIKLAEKLESKATELSEVKTTLQAFVPPVEYADVTEDASVDTNVSEPQLGSEQQAVPGPSKKRKKRKNKKAKALPAPEEPESCELVSPPLADQVDVNLDQTKTEETDSAVTETFPEETEAKGLLPESLENVVEEASAQTEESEPERASEQQLTADLPKRRKRPVEIDTTESPCSKQLRICKPVPTKTRLAKRRAEVHARLSQKTSDKTGLGLPWTFTDSEPEIEASLPNPVSITTPPTNRESVPELDASPSQTLENASEEVPAQMNTEPSNNESEEVESSDISDEAVVSEFLGEETNCSSQSEPPKKPKVSLWRRFKKALTPARRRKYKSDTPVVVPDQSSPETSKAAEDLLQSPSLDDQDRDSSLASQPVKSEELDWLEEETSDDEDEEISDEEEESSDDEVEASADEVEASADEEETSADEDGECSDQSEYTSRQKISLWGRFKKAFTPASKRQFKRRLKN